MSKRFIDTGIFDDEWFMNLPKDSKLLWIYFITKCDHAGMIKVNERLCKLQTDIKDLNETIKQLGNRLVTVNEHLYFIPKYIEFQYPNFPNSKVRQQSSAIDILIKYGLFDLEKQTVNKELPNSYVNVNDNDIGNDTVKYTYSKFYDNEISIAQNETYEKFVKFLYGDNDLNRQLIKLTKMRDQVTFAQFEKLRAKAIEKEKRITELCLKIENNKHTYASLYMTLNDWLNRGY
jgi:hypothetical protein